MKIRKENKKKSKSIVFNFDNRVSSIDYLPCIYYTNSPCEATTNPP